MSSLTCIYEFLFIYLLNRRTYVTFDDIRAIPSFHDQTLLAIKASAGTQLEVPRPDDSGTDVCSSFHFWSNFLFCVQFEIMLRSTQGELDVVLIEDPLAEEGLHSDGDNGELTEEDDSDIATANVPAISASSTNNMDTPNSAFQGNGNSDVTLTADYDGMDIFQHVHTTIELFVRRITPYVQSHDVTASPSRGHRHHHSIGGHTLADVASLSPGKSPFRELFSGGVGGGHIGVSNDLGLLSTPTSPIRGQSEGGAPPFSFELSAYDFDLNPNNEGVNDLYNFK